MTRNSYMHLSPIPGTRTDICAGKHPMTQEEREEEIRDDLKSKWTTYLIVGIIVAALVAAILTFVIMKFCCSGNSAEVTPRR